MKKNLLILSILLFTIFTTGCNDNKQMVIERVNPIQLRSIQTKQYENQSKESIMRASLSAMQDLGFVVDRADMATGTVTGTKWEEREQVKLSLIIKEDVNEKSKIVSLRANAQKGIYPIEVPQPYQAFFNVVHKALFLENN